jgi:hypothetical protein
MLKVRHRISSATEAGDSGVLIGVRSRLMSALAESRFMNERADVTYAKSGMRLYPVDFAHKVEYL